ncbi:Sulfate adenylyltransferase [Candidatus Nitrosocosmicus oleophilus]|jgi:sulfate adenylyltransferase|uniref:Sulfate adenylyltransferase n=1 Tax=Candidatus Nitrosocosmicus oleophilus TaxID=1353260 RepID=A0A654LU95_9ARCH|nr:sulfate adenylyltransferase [Candidatus Nitrosocosmicus oleophilus]ALI34988.1 Sulfate adenylyltransferase [Candidatus Nitrosocosmicus oleophilus]
MPRPHGGSLTNNFIDLSRIDKDLFTLDVDTGLKMEIENISFGVFSPLKGFLNEEDFTSVVKRGRLSNDLPWTIPIVLDANEEVAKKVKDSSQVALRNDGQIFGVMQVEDLYKFDKTESAKSVFQTDDPSHPGFNKFVTMQDILIAGEVKTVSTTPNNKFLEDLRLTPAESRKKIEDRGWKSTVAFQTRNVPHVAHEMLQKAALNIYDGLFINPLIGKKKVGDFKDEVILNSYTVLIDNYYPKYRIIFSTLHTEMKYAGPREAIHHAIMRQNFGCSHIIIGRDHAGVGNYYSPFAAHDIFKDYPELEIEPIFFPAFYYCKKCQSYVNDRTCPHYLDYREELSGTKMRKMFSSGELPPSHLMRPEISKVILSYPRPFVE